MATVKLESETITIMNMVESQEKTTACGGNIPELWPSEMPPGLVGEIAQWMLDTSRRPQPRLAVGAALVLVGTAAGRHVMGPTEAGTALYVLGLAPTGSGKDHYIKCIEQVMARSCLKNCSGPSEFMSMTSVIETMKEQPVCLCAMDEFGAMMNRVFARQASAHERGVMKVLRTAWGSNFTITSFPAWKGVKKTTLSSSHLSLFGTSTDAEFYQALSGGAITDGTLNRFLILQESRVPSRNPRKSIKDVPQSILDGLQRVYDGTVTAMQTAMRMNSEFDPSADSATTNLEWEDDGIRLFWEQGSKIDDERMEGDADNASMYVRTSEMTIRIATIIAAGCDNMKIGVEHIEYGARYARQSEQTMVAGAGDYIADNDVHDQSNRVTRLLKRKGGSATHSEMLRGLRTIRAREFSEIMGTLTQAGMVSITQTIGKNGPSGIVYKMEE